MSMSTSWLIERDSGRYYYDWDDENGKTWRRYYDESDAGASYTNYTAAASHPYGIPRSGPSSQQTRTTYTRSHRETRYPEGGGQGLDQSARGHVEDLYTADSITDGVGRLSVNEYDTPYKAVSNVSTGGVAQTGRYDTHYRDFQTAPTTQPVAYDIQYKPNQWQPVSPSRNEPRESYQGIGKAVDETQQGLQATSHRHVAGTEGRIEALDSSYRVRNTDYKTFFKVGRVFSTLWTEGTETGENNQNQTFLSSVSVVAFNQKAYSKVRRFVVVREGDRCCTCLPVTTYDGRGYKKRGINLTEHGQIYAKSKPKTISEINRIPLKVKLSHGGRIDDKLSLVHYGKVYTVETNVKVKDVGDLDSDSRRLLRRYFKDVFVGDDNDGDDPLPTRAPGNQASDLVGVGSHTTPYSTQQSYQGQASSFDNTSGVYGSVSRNEQANAYTVNPNAGFDSSPSYSTSVSGAGQYTESNSATPRRYDNITADEDINLPTHEEVARDSRRRESTTSGRHRHRHKEHRDDKRR